MSFRFGLFFFKVCRRFFSFCVQQMLYRLYGRQGVSGFCVICFVIFFGRFESVIRLYYLCVIYISCFRAQLGCSRFCSSFRRFGFFKVLLFRFSLRRLRLVSRSEVRLLQLLLFTSQFFSLGRKQGGVRIEGVLGCY